MKTNLSHILSVSDACKLLGESTVRRVVRSVLQFKQCHAALSNSRSNSSNGSNSNSNTEIQNPGIPVTTDPQEELTLCKALFHAVPPQQDETSLLPVPAEVSSAWNRLTQRPGPLSLDKVSFLQWAVPHCAAPFAGPGGHLGLFDCVTYSLQATAQQQHGSASSSASAMPVVLLPDLIIFFAICRAHGSIKNPNVHSNENFGAMLLSVMAFRIYDSYQKRGTVTRDTLHKFMSDVYGEESYKSGPARDVLDRMFTVPEPTMVSSPESEDKTTAVRVLGRVIPSLTATQFCKGISETLTEAGTTKHVLLDWVASLGIAMLPPHDLAQSTQAYLETISSTNRSIGRLCHKFALEESRLYEIKRRFHSMVESSNVLIHHHGDGSLPMTEQQGEAATGGAAAAAGVGDRPRHVITQDAFVKAASTPNHELGHGGYLPKELAKLTFDGGCPPRNPDNDNPTSYWAMYDVLLFGCLAVRQDPQDTKAASSSSSFSLELPLLRFVFRVFCLMDHGDNDNNTNGNATDPNNNRVLSRRQIGKMLLLLMEHAKFRLQADAAKEDEIFGLSSSEEAKKLEEEEKERNKDACADPEEKVVDVAAASLLGILPLGFSANDKNVKLGVLIDYVLEETVQEGETVPQELTFEGFCTWYKNSSHSEKSLPVEEQRVGPYLLELRLVASVLFGIPPTRASMERDMLDEIHSRHKYRYPQTEVSRRGPRGTVWYVIDDLWYNNWQNHIQKAIQREKGETKEEEDPPRTLGKINNTSLLADNGSLALRPNMRWRQDYEIIAPLAWSALQAWYDGGPPIYRTVVPYIPKESAKKSPHSRSNETRIRTEHEIELYPLFVTVFLCDAASRGEARPFQQYVPVSRVSPLRVLLVQLCKGLDLDPKFGRIWMMAKNTKKTAAGAADNSSSSNNNNNKSKKDDDESSDWLLNLDVNIVNQHDRSGEVLKDGGNTQSMVLLLEIKDAETGKWPRGLDGRQWTFQKSNRLGDEEEETLTGDGVVGLYNMGNTCYLNSSIQCLSHTPVFRDYFTSKAYLKDINTTNPLGQQGRMAQVSAVLINTLWKRFNQSVVHQPRRVTAPGLYAPVTAPAITPKTFKEALGKFNNHFAGNEQHDAQELLAFLLGGLSEDLNRIVDKPYIEAPDSDGRPDSELADIWWSNHLKREMSIIVALFTGQYKSLLTCRSCKYESARFEPFSFLQLPLPEDDKIPVNLVLYPLQDLGDTMKYTVRVRHNGRLLDVLMALGKLLHEESVALDEEGNAGKAAAAKSKDQNDGEDDSAEQLALEDNYARIAQNMAVVDMREGFIFKIAPNSWALPDLQNKETGELPLLHVYELEPVVETEKTLAAAKGKTPPKPEEEKSASDDQDAMEVSGEEESEDGSSRSSEDSNGAKKVPKNQLNGGTQLEGADTPTSDEVKYSFLAIAQRMTEVIGRNQLHPFSHKVFGTPLLLRVIDLEGYSGRDLYDLVAKRIRNFVPKSALRFLVDDNKSPPKPEEEKDAGKQRSWSRQRRQRTSSEMENAAAGSVPRYGFRLRVTSRDGRRCALCPWFECCIGCLIPDDDSPTIAVCGDSIVIDWHFAVDIATSGFGLRNQADGTAVPPALRTRTTCVTVKNHASCDGTKQRGYAGAITLEDCLDSFSKEERIPEAYCSSCKDFRVQTKRMSLWRLPPVVIIHLKRFQFTQHMRRKLRDLVVFPIEGLDLSRIVASDDSSDDSKERLDANGDARHDADETTNTSGTEATDETEEGSSAMPAMSPASKNAGRSIMLYDLYGVVHHQGALSGGHYVASLKSELDGQWRLFNDAQVYEIHSRDVVDSSAYILFYIRRDVAKSNLQDYWDISAREGEGLTEEEMEKLIKGRSDRCVIS